MIRTKCECGRVLRTKDENAGRQVNCPDCGASLRLPTPRAQRRRSAGPTLPGRRPGVVKTYDRSREDVSDNETSGAKVDQATKYLLVLAGVVGACVLTGVVVWLVNSSGDNMSTAGLPKEFVHFDFSAGQFSCDQPKDWEVMYGGGTGGKPPFAKFTDDEISIEVRAAVSGSVISDMVSTPGPDGQPPDPMRRVTLLHDLRREQPGSSTGTYKESDPELVQTKGFGPSLMASYEKDVMIDTDYGYRATVVGPAHQYNVTLYCPKRDVRRYKPVFVRVLSSLGPPAL